MREGSVSAESQTIKPKVMATPTQENALLRQDGGKQRKENSFWKNEMASDGGAVPIKIGTMETTAVLDAGITENVMNFEVLYQLEQFPKLQQCEKRVVSTDSGGVEILGKFCPRVSYGKVVESLTLLVSHDIEHSVILGSSFLDKHNLEGKIPQNSRRVATPNVERVRKVERVGPLTTALLTGTAVLAEHSTPMQSNTEASVCLNPSKDDESAENHHTSVKEELLEPTPEVESTVTWQAPRVAKSGPRQIPEAIDSVETDDYIEELLQELETDEAFKFSPEELDFDVDQALADINTFLEESHSIASNSIAVARSCPAEENSDQDAGTSGYYPDELDGISQEGKCVPGGIDMKFDAVQKRVQGRRNCVDEVNVGSVCHDYNQRSSEPTHRKHGRGKTEERHGGLPGVCWVPHRKRGKWKTRREDIAEHRAEPTTDVAMHVKFHPPDSN